MFTFNDYRDFSPEELSMLVTLGSRCAGALERASLYERDRDIALTFQRRLMPALPRTPPWIEIAASYRPASGLAIGGDWYQVLDAGGGRVATVVGDAVGHGLVAAAAMGQLRASIATAVANDAEPSHAIAAVDLFAVQGADTLGASVGVRPVRPRRTRQVRQRRSRSVGAGSVGATAHVAGRRSPATARIPSAPEDHTVTADFAVRAGRRRR